MRLAPTQTNYKLKIAVEEAVMRKARLQKIACEN